MRSRRNQRGQMSLVVALMITTFLFLLGFAVGVGVLVNAKINLQNAADMAAYSGAAVQARQLTHISYLNYEMRRQLKKYLFRNYVLGSYYQSHFPKSAGETGVYDWSNQPASRPPDPPQPKVTMGVPTLCVYFSANDNFCQTTAIKAIAIPPLVPTDPISVAQNQAFQTIQKAHEKNCMINGWQNEVLQHLWLFNADPYLTGSFAPNMPAEVIDAVKKTGGAATGVGLVPREILLRMRIDTLASYINAPALSNLDRAQVGQLQGLGTPENERPIQAFLSAYNTLGPHTFPSGSFSLDELLPTSGNNADLIELEDVKVPAFNSFATQFELDAQRNCVAKLKLLKVNGDVPMGVIKSPKKLTYYAVRLNATVSLPFFGAVSMKAVSAAQPFGSRIGPPLAVGSDIFAKPMNPDAALLAGGGSPIQLGDGVFPNLPVFANDSSNASGGWNSRKVLGAMYAQLQAVSGGAGISIQAAEQMYTYAMAPNPWERDQYNIPTSFPDPFVVNFDSTDTMAFWAPVMPLKDQSQLTSKLRNRIESIVLNTASSGAESQAFAAHLVDSLTQYVSTNLMNGSGEDGEGFKIVRIKDPLSTRDATGKPVIASVGGGITMTSATDIKSSYNTYLNPIFEPLGRSGYSVKFVSFKQLLTPGSAKSNGTETWTNILRGDPDLPLVKH